MLIMCFTIFYEIWHCISCTTWGKQVWHITMSAKLYHPTHDAKNNIDGTVYAHYIQLSIILTHKSYNLVLKESKPLARNSGTILKWCEYTVGWYCFLHMLTNEKQNKQLFCSTKHVTLLVSKYITQQRVPSLFQSR